MIHIHVWQSSIRIHTSFNLYPTNLINYFICDQQTIAPSLRLSQIVTSLHMDTKLEEDPSATHSDNDASALITNLDESLSLSTLPAIGARTKRRLRRSQVSAATATRSSEGQRSTNIFSSFPREMTTPDVK